MKLLHVLVISCLLSVILQPGLAAGQSRGIHSGDIYTLKSKKNNTLLDVLNASMHNGAPVDVWISTGSDAQRWIVKDNGDNVFTFRNVASGKLLHMGDDAGMGQFVDQQDEIKNDGVKWSIKKAGNGYYFLQPEGTHLALSVEKNVNGSDNKLDLLEFSGKDNQKWRLEKQAPQGEAPTVAIADTIFDAWYSQYHIQSRKGFWDKAEMMEVVLDAFEVTRNKKYMHLFDTMYTDFMGHNKSDWMYNNYNDDITWAVLFCVRGYLLSGNKAYLEQGKRQFDKMYARAFTNSYGGGLIWYETKTSKNACINGPAIVACCYLAKATGDNAYYDKAIALYSWSKLYLLNAKTGKVNDAIDFDKQGNIKTSFWSSTYNQGTFLGAAAMLYQHTKEKSYLQEAERIARYTRDSMFNGQVMNTEDNGNDLPGFKGIFARYARMYTFELKRDDLKDWMLLNAKVAYNNRNSSNLIQTKWGTRTPEKKPESAFGCSTAVSLLFNCLIYRN